MSVFFVSFIFYSCEKSENEIEINQPKEFLGSKFTNESDDIINHPSDIYIQNGKIFLSEREISNVQVFDLDFNHLNTFGEYGEGPDNYYYLGSMGAAGDGKFFLQDIGHQRIQIMSTDSQELLNEFTVSNSLHSKNLAIKGKKAYYIIPEITPRVMIYDIELDSYEEKELSSYTSITPITSPLRQIGNILSLEDEFIFVRTSEPVIDLFDENFNKIDSIDLSSLNLFSKQIAKGDSLYKKGASNMVIHLISDAYVADRSLYIKTASLITSWRSFH